jgi:hypothetical protein
MQHRKQGHTQAVAAAKAGVSERSARRIDKAERSPRKPRHWRTREDPLAEVWNSELVPLLEREPSLTGLTLLEYLDDNYPGRFQQSHLRTLQRRVQRWRALHGPEQEVIFRQKAVPGRQGLSDFTHPNDAITVAGEPFPHLLYQFRLAYSGWRSVTVVRGGESYAALSSGLQRALRQAGGVPEEHRTDSLSAARNNQVNRWTDQYQGLCDHYGLRPTTNNLGQSHENGAVECAHGSLKRRLRQALKLRGSSDFASLEDYQGFVDTVARRLNRRVKARFIEEQASLRSLPEDGVADFAELSVKVTRSATIEVRHVLYTVPSRLVGQRLRIHLYHDHLEAFAGGEPAFQCQRIYPAKGQSRARAVDYRHVIHALAAKPQAFRYSQLRDDLLPNNAYRKLWALADAQFEAHTACRWIVGLLRLAADHDIEDTLSEQLLEHYSRHQRLPELDSVRAGYRPRHSEAQQAALTETVRQHAVADYDRLLCIHQAVDQSAQAVEVCHD